MTIRQRSSASTPTPTMDKGKSIASTSTSTTASSPSSPTSSPAPNEEGYSYTRNLWLARLLRFLGPIGFFWHTWFLSPRGIRVTSTERIPTRDGHEIKLNIYRPRRHQESTSSPSSTSSTSTASTASTSEKRICIVNFHGGGWTIGSSTDDARWARWCVDHLGAVFISVEYRLAPEWPWPTPVLDCIDATRYIVSAAERLGVDRDKVVMSGFSAGGCLAVTTALALAHPSLEPTTTPTEADVDTEAEHGSEQGGIRIKGIVSFYPLLDFSTPRPEKVNRARRPSILRPLPRWMTNLFDTSYLPPPSTRENKSVIDRTHPLISPLLSSGEMLEEFPNVHLCLCERDVLAQEGQDFADRLTSLEGGGGGEVVVRWVEGEAHGWDKPPHLVKRSVGEEYDAAVESIRRWCA